MASGYPDIDGSRMTDAQVLMLGLIAQRGVNGISFTELLDALSVLMPDRGYKELRNYPYKLTYSGWCLKALREGVPCLFPGLRALDAATQVRADELMRQVALVNPVLRTQTRNAYRPRFSAAPEEPSQPSALRCRSVFEWRGSTPLNPRSAVEQQA